MITNLKMSKAKAGLIMEQPFFASLLCQMPMVEDDTLDPPTMATDMKTIWYHPKFVEDHTLEETKFVLCHEVGHTIFQHGWRRGARNPRKWNRAGDYIINDLLTNEKVGKMPAGGLLNPGLVAAGNGTSEGVYDLLPDEPDDNKPGQGGSGSLDDCRDAPGSAGDKAADQAQLKVRIAQAAQAARACGKMSGNLQRFIDDALEAKVDWRTVLRNFVSSKAKVDRTFARPKRRFAGEDIYLPSLSGEKLGAGVVAIDCSGSCWDDIPAFAAEFKAIWEDCMPISMDVLYFDTRVSHHEHFDRDDDLHIEGHGGGGTAFSPIFRYVEEQGIEPTFLVVLTDLECADFGPQPHYPVLWVTNHATHAPWGEVVEMHQNL